jgi:hypothetical protein
MLKPMDYNGDASEIVNSADRPLYKAVTIDWSRPRTLTKSGKVVLDDDYTRTGYLYALVRNHGNSRSRDVIQYVGITNDLNKRFVNHPKFDEIRSAKGDVGLSIGTIDFGKYRTAIGSGNRRAIEELEHILIWTVWDDLWNDKKQSTLPGMGQHPGRAWDIKNEGYKFSGRMPGRILYPWIVVEPRRNRTAKPKP